MPSRRGAAVRLHPALLDAALQAGIAAARAGEVETALLLFSWAGVCLRPPRRRGVERVQVSAAARQRSR